MEELTHVQRILDVHMQQLFNKGYTEKHLDSKDPDGTFNRRLAEEFRKKVDQSFKTSKDRLFSITIEGQPDKTKDPIRFTFNYECVPYPIALRLNSLSADLSGSSEVYAIKALHRDLPVAQQVFKYLLAKPAKNLMQNIASGKHEQQRRSIKRS